MCIRKEIGGDGGGARNLNHQIDNTIGLAECKRTWHFGDNC
jgi:hypothetical protein